MAKKPSMLEMEAKAFVAEVVAEFCKTKATQSYSSSMMPLPMFRLVKKLLDKTPKVDCQIVVMPDGDEEMVISYVGNKKVVIDPDAHYCVIHVDFVFKRILRREVA